jgi:small conductance mechanosensitive channel
MPDSVQFDMTAVFQRLLDQAYRVIATLPLLILALLII